MKVLVAYETGHGSTEEVAETIAEVMREAGSEVAVRRCREVEDASGYDAFVVGSPISFGKWLRPAVAFLKNNAELLKERPTAVFLMSFSAGFEQYRQEATEKYAPRVVQNVEGLEPVSVGCFGGVLQYPKYSVAIRAMIMALAKSANAPTSGTHDYRDWDEIKAWAAEVHGEFVRRLGE